MATKRARTTQGAQPQDGATTAAVRHAVVPLEALAPHPRNYRHHPDEQIGRLVASLQRFGQVRSIVVQEGAPGRYLVVAGHGVVEAARRGGWVELAADVIPATWSADQVEGYLVADNEHARGAEDDLEALLALVEGQRGADFALETLGFDEAGLDALLAELDATREGDEAKRDVDDPDGGGDDFDATPDEEGPTRCRPGDLWLMGGYTVCPKCQHHNPLGVGTGVR